MYTTKGKANDRFGFHSTGFFKCAYYHDRIIAVAGIVIIVALIILLIVNVLFYLGMFDGQGSIGNMFDIGRILNLAAGMGSEEDHHLMEAFSSEMINMSVVAFSTAFFFFVLIILAAAYLLTLIILHKGQKYEFKADDEMFVVTYPKRMHRTATFRYEDVLGITWEERKSFILPHCYEFTVTTRSGSYDFKYIMNKIALANGVQETPFNIIREKIGVANEDEYI